MLVFEQCSRVNCVALTIIKHLLVSPERIIMVNEESRWTMHIDALQHMTGVSFEGSRARYKGVKLERFWLEEGFLKIPKFHPKPAGTPMKSADQGAK